MKPNVASVLKGWTETVRVKSVDRQTVNFDGFDLVTGRDIQAVVQPADMERLNAGQIDWSLKYYQLHTTDVLNVGEFVVIDNEDFKIVPLGDYQRYGYTEVVAEQTKKPLLVENA